MRPVFYFIPISILITARVAGQGAASLVLREPCWIEQTEIQGITWVGLSRQYHGLAQWNATGAGIIYTRDSDASAFFLVRDGIPGYSFYHLYLSHRRIFKPVSCMLQLRVSMLAMVNHPPALRLGGTLDLRMPVGERSGFGVTLYDFTSFLLPRAAPARADPMVRLQAWQSPGRRLDLFAAFDLSPSHPGPLCLGTRLRLDEQWLIFGAASFLPVGFSLGTIWSSGKLRVVFSLGTGVLGLTPTLIFQHSQS
jgi:hypothetical protein